MEKKSDIRFYLTEAEKKQLKLAASENNMSVNQYVRKKVFGSEDFRQNRIERKVLGLDEKIEKLFKLVSSNFDNHDKNIHDSNLFSKKFMEMLFVEMLFMFKYSTDAYSGDIKLIQKRLEKPNVFVSYLARKAEYEIKNKGLKYEDSDQYKEYFKNKLG